uniref:Polycystin cation channel PKD1/PKD2 domain-containing protein n=1 Tax=Nothobranchius pienaari TaxID=704102 RepID=A0A1A8M952_9TELE
MVEDLPSSKTNSGWLGHKSQTELVTLVQHGNPQEIIPYSIALISKLNQMKSGGTAEELRTRREIRESVSRALASVPVSSLQTVEQLSSALTLSTVVPAEMVSEGCQETVLAAVETMIRVVEQQICPTQSSEVVQVLLGMDAKLESDPFLDAANPPISTTLVAMELNSPQGLPLPIQDLTPEQAIQITLPNKYLGTPDERGRNGKVQEAGNRTCPTATLANAGQENFTVKVPDNLDENAGLYQYRVLVKTGLRPGAGTTAHVGISLFGVSRSGSHHLQKEGAFQRGGLDQFQVETYDNLGEIWKIRIWHDNTGSPSSLLESKALDSSIMNFWTSSGLVPLKERPDQLGALTWQSHDSLLCSLAGTCATKEAMCRTSPATRQLKRKKAIIQLHLALPPHNDDAFQRVCSPCSQSLTEDTYHHHKTLVQSSPKSLDLNSSPAQVYKSKHLTLSEEDLLMSVAAEGTSEVINSNSDSGRDSPRTTSSFSASQGGWSDERSSSSSLYGGEAEQSDSELDFSSYGTGFYKCSSLHSMESLASTFLPQPLQESIHPSSTTRIGVARGRPRWLLPSWVLHVVHPLMALLVVACLAVVGLYGSLFSRAVVLMLLVSMLAAFLTSAMLLEPLKVCVQAFTCTLLWRSVDPEVEELLAQEAMVVRASAESGGNVRPPCGYGLLQAKQEARKIRALHSLMRHCVCQLGFLLLVLMVNYQDRIEQRQASLLHSAIRQHLHSTHPGSPNLTSLRDWSDAEWWIGHTLIQHLHQNPTLHLVGLPQVRFTHTLGASAVDLLGNNSSTTQQLLTSLLIVFGELWSMLTERAQYFYQCRHWFQLLLAFVSLMTAFLQLWFLSLASLCVSKMQSMQESFIDFHSAALLAYRSSQCAAVLLTLLALKLLGTLRFVRRWVMMGRVLQRASRELWAVAVLVVLLLLICSHLGNMLFNQSVEGFLSVKQTWVSVTSMLRSRRVLGQLCRVHPVLGPLYGLLVYGGSIWLLARLCGAVLIHVYREKQMELLHSTIEPQDYEMVEFFIKRLKLWMGLTKAKQFRHSVKFEDMDTPPSRSSQGSAFSTLSSSIPSSCSPSLSSSFPSLHPPSSVLSVTSEDFLVSKPNQEVQPCLDGLEPIVSTLLSSFDRVSQLTEDIYNLEVMLHEAQERQRKRRTSNRMDNEMIDVESTKPKEPKEENVPAEVRHRKIGLLYPKSRISLPSLSTFSPFTTQSSFTPPFCFPRVRSSYSESESAPLQSQLFKLSKTSPGVPTPMSAQNISCFNSNSTVRFPKRRAWHSGSSHSADPAQRISQSSVVPLYGGETLSFSNVRPRSKEEVRSCMGDRLQLKRKAWISEGPEREED